MTMIMYDKVVIVLKNSFSILIYKIEKWINGFMLIFHKSQIYKYIYIYYQPKSYSFVLI